VSLSGEAVLNERPSPTAPVLPPKRTRRKKAEAAPAEPVNAVSSIGEGTTPEQQGAVARFIEALDDVKRGVRDIHDLQVRSRYVAYHIARRADIDGPHEHVGVLAACRAELCGEYQRMMEEADAK
jgi:hypothetical protein